MRDVATRYDRAKSWESPLKTIHLLWLILAALLATGVVVGRNVVTKEEADKIYLRQDVYSRDYDNLTGQLTGIETRLTRIDDKLDRALEAPVARP